MKRIYRRPDPERCVAISRWAGPSTALHWWRWRASWQPGWVSPAGLRVKPAGNPRLPERMAERSRAHRQPKKKILLLHWQVRSFFTANQYEVACRPARRAQPPRQYGGLAQGGERQYRDSGSHHHVPMSCHPLERKLPGTDPRKVARLCADRDTRRPQPMASSRQPFARQR